MPNLLRYVFNFDHPWLDFNLRLSATCLLETCKVGLMVGSSFPFVPRSARILSRWLCKGRYEGIINCLLRFYLIGIVGHRLITTGYRLAPDESLPEIEPSRKPPPSRKSVRPWLNRYFEITAVTVTWTFSLLIPNVIRVSLARLHAALAVIGLNALVIMLYLEISNPLVKWHHIEHKMTLWVDQYLMSPERQRIQSERKRLSDASLIDDQRHSTYEYAPLKSPEFIRLLKIEVCGGETAIYRLISVNLEDAPSYEALSYCWGSPLIDKEFGISVDSAQTYINITKNVYEILRGLTPLADVRHLWIDSICINQGDLLERSLHTQLMSKIFGNAQSVIVFLGGEIDSFGLGSVLSKAFYFYMVPSNYENLENLGSHAIYDQTFLQDKDLEVLHLLLQNEYWNRTWIIQECALAKEISLLIGSVKVSWNLFITTMELLKNENGFRLTMFEKFGDYFDANIPIQRILSLGVLRSICQSDDPAMPLVHLVVAHNYTRATDLRDKVYAFLGLCQRSDGEIIKPNYEEKDFIDVSMELVSLALQQKSFLPLSIAGFSYDTFSLDAQQIPSWVPRLAQKLQMGIGEFHDGSYMAGLTTAPDFRISTSQRVLTLRGLAVDSIIDKCADGDVFEFMNNHFRDSQEAFLLNCIKRWTEMAELFVQHFDSSATSDGENLARFWRTVLHPFQAEDWAEICDRTSWIRMYNEMIASGGAIKNSPWQLTIREIYKERLQDEVTGFEDLVAITTPMRTFAITKTKQLPASVPRGTEIGDIVVIMKGAPAPFILRPTGREDGGYFLIGEAYVDEIMYGEAMDEAKLIWFDLY